MWIINPANEELIADARTDSAAAVAEKYARARAAQPAWAAVPLDQRLAAMPA